MPTRISNTAAIALANAVTSLVDAGPSLGYVEIRTGTQPAGPDAAASGDLLATVQLLSPAFNTAVDANPGGRASVNGVPSSVATGTGLAGWFRVFDSAGVGVLDGSCGTTGSGNDMELADVTLESSQPVRIVSWSITMPEG